MATKGIKTCPFSTTQLSFNNLVWQLLVPQHV